MHSSLPCGRSTPGTHRRFSGAVSRLTPYHPEVITSAPTTIVVTIFCRAVYQTR